MKRKKDRYMSLPELQKEIINPQEFISRLDCERFGFKIAKIDFKDHAIGDAIHSLRQYGVQLIITRVNAADLALVNTLESWGFKITDSQVTYKHNFNNTLPDFSQLSLPNISIREFAPGDIEAISAIAKTAFLGYGHYFADRQLDRQHCGEIYEDWAKNCCIDSNYADKIFVASVDGAVVGFVSYKIQENSQGRYAMAVINAVAESHRGYGIYSALVRHGLVWSKQAGCQWQEHNVITTNYPVHRSLAKLGFSVVNALITLHGWMDKDLLR